VIAMDANAIHARLGANGWRNVLAAAGLSDQQLSKRPGPCPICGGTDRYHFHNRRGQGDFLCRKCGVNDGFFLLMGALKINFSDARKMVMDLAGIEETKRNDVRPVYKPPAQEVQEIARPTPRVVKLLKDSCLVENLFAVCEYLCSRELWPLPKGHALRGHPSVDYFEEGRKVACYPALLAPVRDIDGELVTVHVTYLTEDGSKLKDREPRKILSKLAGREGCAVPLMPFGDQLGIAEGIETALSAARIHQMPVWSALNAGLLAKFSPPEAVNKLVIFADRDIAGLEAATALMQRLQNKVLLEIRTPKTKDWNDALRGAA
jgi:putative DNA primase/helicase